MKNEWCSNIHKIIDGFYCARCGWASERDPNFSDAVVESVIEHIETPDNPVKTQVKTNFTVYCRLKKTDQKD